MSKALEALERMVYNGYVSPNVEELKIIESALKEHELMKEIRITARFDLEQVNKEHKALEIIKKKPIVALVDYKYTYEEWLDLVEDKDLFENKEEYELLKEVLL